MTDKKLSSNPILQSSKISRKLFAFVKLTDIYVQWKNQTVISTEILGELHQEYRK